MSLRLKMVIIAILIVVFSFAFFYLNSNSFQSSDLVITSRAEPDRIKVSEKEESVVTIVYTNNAESSFKEVQLVFKMDTDLRFTTKSLKLARVNPDSNKDFNKVIFDLPDLEPGHKREVQVSVAAAGRGDIKITPILQSSKQTIAEGNPLVIKVE